MFVPSAEAAVAAAKPLRKSLWGKHKLAVLLPDGKEAVRVMQDFKNQLTTILLCTPEVERGLDMPGVDFVYSLDAPSSTAVCTIAGVTGPAPGTLCSSVCSFAVLATKVRRLAGMTSPDRSQMCSSWALQDCRKRLPLRGRVAQVLPGQ